MAESLTSNLARWPSFHPPTDSDSAALNEAHNETQNGARTRLLHTQKILGSKIGAVTRHRDWGLNCSLLFPGSVLK